MEEENVVIVTEQVPEPAVEIPEANTEQPTSEAEAFEAGFSAALEQTAANTSSTAKAVPLLHEEKAKNAPRDWESEWRELAAAHPEVVGKEMPADIYEACLASELPPIRVYESMMLSRMTDELAKLQAENAALKQNAATSARAPVTASSGGVSMAPEDSFLRGFNFRYH